MCTVVHYHLGSCHPLEHDPEGLAKLSGCLSENPTLQLARRITLHPRSALQNPLIEHNILTPKTSRYMTNTLREENVPHTVAYRRFEFDLKV